MHSSAPDEPFTHQKRFASAILLNSPIVLAMQARIIALYRYDV
tara:strand:- start:1663 stop:1791 length:129 start_codon:yes stop_codon:yes gene_type:complete